MIEAFITLIYFAIILGVIVLVHEFGHFFFAKKFGVFVHEFSIGMGPKIWGRRKGETEYSIRAIPLGGYCSLAGEDGEETDEDGKKIPRKRKLFAKTGWQRFIILVMGAGNNFILALILLFSIGLFVGSPNMDPVVNELTPGYPMEKAGIQEGDKVISINGAKTKTSEDIQVRLSLVKAGSDVTFEIERDGKRKEYKVTPVAKTEEGEKHYYYGITFKTEMEHGVLNALRYTFQKTGALIRQMVLVLQLLFTGNLSINRLGGPVAIYSTVGEAKMYGIATLVQLTALLSINVGFINLLPFPAVDGGRILLLIIEKIKGKPLNPKVEESINLVGFILLMILAFYITCHDLFNIFGK
ncbi:MAG: RIP metalloprotease RseP [Bacilli bacterium]|nr:RIP metalloprotease RseP [Bacilli bacterium]